MLSGPVHVSQSTLQRGSFIEGPATGQAIKRERYRERQSLSLLDPPDHFICSAIGDRERSALQLFPLPLLEQAQSHFVGQGSTRPHQVGKSECTPKGSASVRP